jgi:soluble lytic murein transglycosylase-like protein
MDLVSTIEAEAQAQGVDPTLAVAVANQESGLNPSALGSSGEIGLFQLMPATAASLGVDPSDVSQNIQGGIRYLKEQLSTFGDTAQALAAYNWGPLNVTQAVAAYGGDWLENAPASVQAYVESITEACGGALPGAGGWPSWAMWGGAAAGAAALLYVLA